MTGSKRRSFQAEIAIKYCGVSARKAEEILGWGRANVALGLAEKRTGISCVGAQSMTSGAKSWEEKHPEIARFKGPPDTIEKKRQGEKSQVNVKRDRNEDPFWKVIPRELILGEDSALKENGACPRE